MGRSQCDQIGRFFKFLRNKFSCKSSPNIWRLFGYFKNHHFLSKNCCGHFWAAFYSIIWSHWWQSRVNHDLRKNKSKSPWRKRDRLKQSWPLAPDWPNCRLTEWLLVNVHRKQNFVYWQNDDWPIFQSMHIWLAVSVTSPGDLSDFGQLLNAFGNT